MSLAPLMTTIDELTLNLAKAEQEVKDLKAKLEKVEADAAVMREALRELKVRIAYIGMPQEPFWMDGDRKVWDWRKQCALLENALHGNNTGQRLLDELANLRATAQSRQDLLKRCEWKVRKSASTMGYCSFCDGIEPDHKPTCSLAAELKEAHD